MPNFELFREAVAIIDGVPDERFDLGVIAKNLKGGPLSATHCGTIGCAMGWLAMHPTFSKSAELSVKKGAYDGGCIRLAGKHMDYADAASAIFGISFSEAEHLFRPNVWGEQSDKAEFAMRACAFLKSHGEPISSEYLKKYGLDA